MEQQRSGAVIPAPEQLYTDLARIWEQSVAATHDFLSGEHFEILRAQVPSFFPAMDHLCAYRAAGGKPCGFVGVKDGKIEMLFVDPDYFGQGIGSTLFDYAVGELDATRVDVNEQNKEALDFYTRKGCRVLSRSSVDPSGMPYPIIHLTIARADNARQG